MVSINSGLRVVTNKLKEVASDIVAVRSGTVVSNYAAMSSTIVTLDNDPDQVAVQAQSLWQALPSGTRVTMIAFPPRGLVIVGVMAAVPPMISGGALFTYATPGTTTFTAANGAPFRALLIEAIAGGGGGGGAQAAGGNSSGGGGGGGGGYARSVVSTTGLIYPLQVNTGTAGAGVSGAAGTAGTDSSVITNNGAGTILVRGLAGQPGGTLAAGATTAQSASGLGGSADFGSDLIAGSPGQRSVRYSTTPTFTLGGMGGAAARGGGGAAEVGTQADGLGGRGFGGGGGGAHSTAAGGAQTGGPASSGKVTIIGIP